jgi:predicted short-subunit dehydrogenase-like oxidoreductase (DUF2520 family)
MRQVPRSKTFLIIGRGRVARHLAHYFTLEGFAFRTHNRHEPFENFKSGLSESTHVLLAISDVGVEPFCLANAEWLNEKTVVHFSGSLSTPLAHGAHPLMTFSNDLYLLETYRALAFICESPDFENLLPGLKNPHFVLDASLKPLYHAWCVMSGNFSTLLWESFFEQLESRMGLPRSVAMPYLKQLTQNLAQSSAGATVLTGPLTRGDSETLARNLGALKSEGSAYASVYTAFVDSYRRDLQ